MLIESVVLGTITLNYKPPEVPPPEVSKVVPKIKRIEPLPEPKIAKVYKVQLKAEKPAVRAVDGSTGLNGYDYPSCTGHVALKRYVPFGWGDASNWRNAASAAGWTISSKPVDGAIGWTPGHVVYVESVNGSTITISENNYDWQGSTRTITVPVDRYLYLY